MAFSSGNTARAALIASELCELCAHLSVHLNDLRIHLSHLSVRLSVHLSDVSDLCLELLHRQHWLDWDQRSCGQRRYNLMNNCSGQTTKFNHAQTEKSGDVEERQTGEETSRKHEPQIF